MNVRLTYHQSTVGIFLLLILPSATNADERVLFSFDRPQSVEPWRTVNDGVMGGRSVGRFKINGDKNLEFFGTLSLANNGGFASVRASGGNLALKKDEVIVVKVRGDGREYKFNVFTQKNLAGYSCRQSFKTERAKWIEVKLPVSNFVATWRGRSFPNVNFEPEKVAGLGFLLGDKKTGPFKLEVARITVGKPSHGISKIASE